MSTTVVDAVITKVNAKRVTNSKELRKLRAILPDPVAREHFMSKEGDLDSAMLRVKTAARKDKSGARTPPEKKLASAAKLAAAKPAAAKLLAHARPARRPAAAQESDSD